MSPKWADSLKCANNSSMWLASAKKKEGLNELESNIQITSLFPKKKRVTMNNSVSWVRNEMLWEETINIRVMCV